MKKVPGIPKTETKGKHTPPVPPKAVKDAAKKVKAHPPRRMGGGKLVAISTLSIAATSLTIYQLEQQDVLPKNLTNMVDQAMKELNK